jgi:hypothetical protein
MTGVPSRTLRVVAGNVACCEVPIPRGLAVASDLPPSHGFMELVNREGADVAMVLEVLERHVAPMAVEMGMGSYDFVPMHALSAKPGDRNRMGMAIFSRTGFVERRRPVYYSGFADDEPNLWSKWQDFDFRGERLSCAVQRVLVRANGAHFWLTQSHAPYCPRGVMTSTQRGGAERLIHAMGGHHDSLIYLDTNMPRGMNDGWAMLSNLYRDNVPAGITTSLDHKYHTAPREVVAARMVDGVFTPYDSRYSVSRLKMHVGISDHLIPVFDVYADFVG